MMTEFTPGSHEPYGEESKKFDCGCAVVYNIMNGDLHIIYCPLHAAAPAMYEALKIAAEYYEMLEMAAGVEHPVLYKIRAALELAGDSDE